MMYKARVEEWLRVPMSGAREDRTAVIVCYRVHDDGTEEPVLRHTFSVETHRPGLTASAIQADVDAIKARLVESAKTADEIDFGAIG